MNRSHAPQLRRIPPALAAGALFTLLALLLYREPLFLGEALYFRDFQLFYMPMKQFLGDALRAGFLPLWNPNVQMGTSFIADPQSGVLYPLSLLFLFADAPAGIALSLALHLVIGQLGLYRLAQSYGMGALPSALGAVIYGIGGWMVSSGNMLTLTQAAAWAPWTILVCERLWRSPRPATIAVAALVIALQMYAGWPEMFFFLAIVLIARRLATPGLFAWRWLAASLAALLLATGLFAPQLLATYEAYQLSGRVGGLSHQELFEFSATAGQFASLLFPPQLASGDWDILAAYPDGHVPLILSLYLGWFAALLVAAGCAALLDARLRKHALVWLCVLAVAAFFAPGDANPAAVPLFDLANRFRSPEKFLFLVHLAAAMLAAGGLAYLMSRLPARFAHTAGTLLLLAVALELVIVNGRIDLHAEQDYFDIGLAAETRAIRQHPGRVYARATVASDRVKELYGNFRSALNPNLGTMADIAYVNGIYFIQPRAHDAVFGLLQQTPGALLARYLGFLGTPYVITDDPEFGDSAEWRRHAQRLTPRLWRLNEAAPLVSFPRRVIEAGDESVFRLAADPEFARGDAVFVPPGAGAVRGEFSGQIVSAATAPGRMDASVTSATGGLLVFRESAYPGWHARVDATDAAITRTNRFFMGVAVPPGQHRVLLEYRPGGWGAGLAIAAVALAILLLTLLLELKRRRDSPAKRISADAR